jgi:hypothetical protein
MTIISVLHKIQNSGFSINWKSYMNCWFLYTLYYLLNAQHYGLAIEAKAITETKALNQNTIICV